MNYDTIIVAAITTIPSTIVALAAYMEAKASRKEATLAKQQSQETYHSVNSRMDQLLKLAVAESAAKATLIEKAAEHVRKGEQAVSDASPTKT